jgi:hypothetical protein
MNNKKGHRNTFIGRNAGFYSDSTSYCTYLGYSAGYNDKGGNRNVYVGTYAGLNSGINGPVDGNTYIGYGAGMNNRNGLANVFIGSNAGANAEDTYCSLIIANNDTENPLIYGNFCDPMLRFNAKYLEFGYGQDIRIGNLAGYNHDPGSTNIFIGNKAGYQQKRGFFNVFVGDSAGYANDTCGWNTYLGCKAGIYDSAGRYNVFIGWYTGRVNTSGTLNAFVGTNAGYWNTSGSENTFLGTSAGGGNISGNNNTCIGRKAGRYNQTGSGNVFLGYFAGENETGSNRLYIANDGTTTPLIYGEFDNEILKFHSETRVVDHDVYITNSDYGVILTSPSGNCFRLTVDDSGNLVTQSITCP